MRSWGDFARAAPELAAFGANLLLRRPAFLATVRAGGEPRVHPVTPILTSDGLYVFMEPTSPKGRDLRERGWFALHNGVPDMDGSGGEFTVRGKGLPRDDAELRSEVARAATYDPIDDYVLFELRLDEARCRGYGDVELPARRRWASPEPSDDRTDDEVPTNSSGS